MRSGFGSFGLTQTPVAPGARTGVGGVGWASPVSHSEDPGEVVVDRQWRDGLLSCGGRRCFVVSRCFAVKMCCNVSCFVVRFQVLRRWCNVASCWVV